MSLFGWTKRLFASDSKSPGPDDDFWYEPVPQRSSSGEDVTVDRALRVSAVMSCVRVLSESIASLPLHVKKRRDDGGADMAKDHPLYNMFHSKVNDRHTSFEWREMGMNALCLSGNFVSLKKPGIRGSAGKLIPIPPGSVRIKQLNSGRLAYDVDYQSGTKQYTEEEVLHIPGMTLDGYIGLNPITYARDTIGLTIATEDHGAKFFRSGGRATSLLEVPGKVTKEVRNRWAQAISGMASSGCIVTDEGIKWTPLQVTNEDMQFLETRKFQLADIARLYRVPLNMIQEHEKSTSWGTGIESFGRQFVTYTLRPWIVRIEQRINADIFGEDSEYFVEFNVDGLLRGNTLERYQAHKIGIDGRFLKPNEAREIEGRNPIDGGNEFPPVAGATTPDTTSKDDDSKEDKENADEPTSK